jgi:predicted phage tail protein
MSADKLQVVHILNPFDTRERRFEELDWDSTKSLADYFPDVAGAADLVISISGKIVVREDFATTFPKQDETVVVCPVPHGGGGSKGVLRLVAMIAVAMVAPQIALAMGATGIGASVLTAGITIAGGMLVNSMLPVKAAQPPASQTSDLSSSTSYGIDGPKNVSAEGVPVPVVYGEFRFGGNLIAGFTENIGNTQYLYMLFNAGEGPYESITDIEINDQPIANFSDVETQVRLGDPDQTIIPWFNDSIEPHNLNTPLSTAFTTYTTVRNDIDKFRVDVVFPAGLYGVDQNDGHSFAKSVDIEIQYRLVGAGTWTPLGTFNVTENNRSAVRRSYYSPELATGRYDIQIRRTTTPTNSLSEVDGVNVSDINEIVLDDVTYKHSALLGLRIRLNDQLSGLPTVTYKVKGRKVKVWNGSAWVVQWSPIPAWIALDMMTNKRFGGGMAEARFDLNKLKELGQHCIDKNLTFNGVFDQAMSLWDASQYVLRCGHAQWVPIGTKYSVMIEKQSTPVMMFSVANIVKGSFKETWLPVADRANEIEISYFDKLDGNKQRTVRVYDSAAIAAGRPARPASITLFGVDNSDQAFNEGVLQLNLNRYILQTCEFEAPVEAIGCAVGDLIYVQHDMPQWGYAGRAIAGSTTSKVMLDRPVPVESGSNYKILVVFDSIQRASGTVTAIAGTNLTLSGYTGGTNVKRIQVAGKDLEVLDVFDAGGGNFGVTVENATGISVTNAYTLHDTDVIEERDAAVVGTGDVTQVDVTSVLPAAPAQFSKWLFGKTTTVKKPFRVRAIAGSHEHTRTITALEYNASVYDPNVGIIPTPNYSALDFGTDQVSIDGVTEDLVRIGTVIRTRATVHYHSNQKTYRRSRVYVSKNGGGFEEITGPEVDRATCEADDGDQLVFKVVAMNVLGVSAPESSAPVFPHTVEGKLAAPKQVQNFRVTKRPTDLILEWDANTDLDLKGYEIRVGESWDAAALVVTNFQGTMHVHDQSVAGVYKYHIRAIDWNDRLSDVVTTTQISLPAPAPVKNFNGLQGGGRVEFFWDANTELDIFGYEIREGISWASSVLVAQVLANRHTIPSGSDNTRTFWIKAIASPGIYSDTAVFRIIDIKAPQDRNVVVQQDEAIVDFPNIKHFCSSSIHALTMADNAQRSEYLFDVSLAATLRAQNSILFHIESVQPDVTWQNATFPWNSSLANRAWVVAGAIDSVTAVAQIATDLGLQAGEVDGWRLNSALDSFTGLPATTGTNVTFGPGRYGTGANIGSTTVVDWTKNVSGAFYLTGWLVPQVIPGATVGVLSFSNGTQSLALRYNPSTGDWTLVDDLGNTITANLPYTLGDRICFGIVQTATQRRLFLAKMPTLNQPATVISSTGAFTPRPAFTSFRLWNGADPKSRMVVSDLILGNVDLLLADFQKTVDNGHAPGFDEFRPFIFADHEYQTAIYRTVMMSTSTDRCRVKDFTVTVDVPDVIDRGDASVVTAATGVTVTFARKFMVTPTITPVMRGGTVVGTPYVDSASETGCVIKIKDPGGTLVAGDVSWTAAGY